MPLGPKRTRLHQSARKYRNPVDWLFWSVFLPTIGTVSTIPEFNAPVGGTAFLFGNTIASPDQRIDWKMGTATIATRIPGSDPTYMGRCAVYRCSLFANGTLQMDQLQRTDNTSYSVTMAAGGQTIIEQVQLNVYNFLTRPSLTPSSNIRPVNGTRLDLRCNGGTQTVHSIYFYRNGELLSCNPAHLSCNRSSTFLYFNPILATDSGNYSCGIENPVSSNRSSGIYLGVSVNVSAVTLRSNTSRPVAAEKEAVALICSSYGTEVTYNWTLKGSPLPANPRYKLIEDNSTLVISPVSKSDEGEFNCRVSNYLNSELSNPLNLTWSPDGYIECGAERLDESVQMSCLWPGGYPPAAVTLKYNNFTHFGLDRVTAVVPSYQSSLGTQLSCSGSHGGSTAACSLLIDTPQSSGFINESLTTANKGSSAFLSVSLHSGKARAAQLFPATFSWFRLNPTPSEIITSESISIVSNDHSSFLIVHSMNQEFNGQYMCTAQNPMGSNSFTFILNVKEEETLSAGAIAGIVIGCIVSVALVALVVVLIFRTRRKSSGKTIDDSQEGTNKRYELPPRQPTYETTLPVVTKNDPEPEETDHIYEPTLIMSPDPLHVKTSLGPPDRPAPKPKGLNPPMNADTRRQAAR